MIGAMAVWTRSLHRPPHRPEACGAERSQRPSENNVSEGRCSKRGRRAPFGMGRGGGDAFVQRLGEAPSRSGSPPPSGAGRDHEDERPRCTSPPSPRAAPLARPVRVWQSEPLFRFVNAGPSCKSACRHSHKLLTAISGLPQSYPLGCLKQFPFDDRCRQTCP